MTWKQFCELEGNVPLWYQNVSHKNLRIPKSADGEDYQHLAELFIANPCNLILRGPPGRGKTHFTYSLIRGLFDSGRARLGDIRFYKSKSFDDRIMDEVQKYKSCTHFIKSVCEIPFFFLDDFGVERDTERANRDYYDFLDTRLYNLKTTVISTNLTEKAITDHYGDRVYSRFKEYFWIDFDGPDLRGGKRL